MTVLGIWGLPRHNAMGNDEIVTQFAARLPLGTLARMVFLHTDIFHALYYLFMHVWVVLGSSATVIRVPSLIAAVAAVALTAHVGRRLSGSGWTGLLAGMVMALTPSTSFYAQTARSYTIVTLVVLGSTLALVRALEAEAAGADRRRIIRRWLLYAVLIAVGGYLNEIALAVLVAHAVTAALARPGRRVLEHWAVAGAVGAALVLPVVIISYRQRSAADWITRPHLHDIGILFHDCFGATNLVSLFLLGCALVAVFAAGRPAWWSRGEISLQSVAVPLLVLPSGTVFAESLVGKALYVDRYVLFCEAGAALLAGAGLDLIGRWLGRRWGRGREQLGAGADRRALTATSLAIAAVVCLGALLLQLGPQHRARTPLTRQFDYGDPAFYVGAHARPGDGVLFFNTFFRKARLLYPRQFRNTDDIGQALSPMQAGTFRGTDKPFSTLRPLMLDRRRIWVVGVRPSVRLSDLLLRQQSLLLTRYFTLVSDRHFRGIEVTLWVRSGTAWPKARSSGGS